MSEDTGSAKSPASESMLSRFAGPDGRKLLLQILGESTLLRGIPEVDQLLDEGKVFDVPSGTTIIEQGGSDNDLFVILSGRVEIRVNGRTVTTRPATAHVGEISLIDPTARRSASVVAIEHTLVLKCSETQLTSFADKYPAVWRRLAVELSRRLTERNTLIRAPRSEPVLFVGSSTEALPVAREIQSNFDHDPVVVELWTDGVFNPSRTPIEDLTSLLERIDFGALLLTPDDVIVSRGEEVFGARDNVIFELGLLIGAIGRERTFLLVPRDVDLKIPSDLLGVKPIDYPQGDESTTSTRLAPACNILRKIINRLGPA